MKIIKGFENEEIEVSDFGEWIGNDYIDYKFEYENNQKLIKTLFQEDQELKEQNQKYKEIIDKAIAHLDLFISSENLSEYDTLKILMHAKKILSEVE